MDSELNEDPIDLYRAKQRASVLWLLSKAYNREIPSELRDPYYKDHDDQDRLKPQIVHGLANAELYCLALANIYADPNYHCLNHHSIIQLLIRKGIYIAKPHDTDLTETILIQTSPIKMSAHMVIIEAIMSLFIKEVLIPEKIFDVVSRFLPVESEDMPVDPEEAAIFWINHSCLKLRHKICEELSELETAEQILPPIPFLEDLQDVSDGCCLAIILSLYCPDHLDWTQICLNDQMSMADSIYNIELVQLFCQEKLPYDICFLSIEDFLYLHPTIRPNVLAFVADLLYLFEIRPAPCVRRPGTKEEFGLSDEECSSLNGSRLRETSCLTPSEMKMKSLQHTSWGEQDPSGNQSHSCQSSSRLHGYRRNSSFQSDEEEDMTKYFSAMDFKDEYDAAYDSVSNGSNGPRSLNPAASYTTTSSSSSDRKILVTEATSSSPYTVANQQRSSITGIDQPDRSTLHHHRNSFNKSSDNSHSSLTPKPLRSDSGSHLVDYFCQIGEEPTQETSPSEIMTKKTAIVTSFANLSKSKDYLISDGNQTRLENNLYIDGNSSSPGGVASGPGINIAFKQKNERQNSFDKQKQETGSVDKDAYERYRTWSRDKLGETVCEQTIVNNLSSAKTLAQLNDSSSMKKCLEQQDCVKQVDNSIRLSEKLHQLQQQQHQQQAFLPEDSNKANGQLISSGGASGEHVNMQVASQIHNVRLKLEEKRRLIEQERRSAEDMWKAKRQDIGKEAFLRVFKKKSDSGVEDNANDKEGSVYIASEMGSSDTSSVKDDEIPNFATDKGFFISFADEKLPQVKPPPLRPKCFRAVTVSRDRRNSRSDLSMNEFNDSSRLSGSDRASIRSLASSENTERSRSENNVPFRLNQRLSNHSNTSLNTSSGINTSINESIANLNKSNMNGGPSYPSSQKSGSNDGDSNKENNSDIMSNNQSDQPRSLTPGVGFIVGVDSQALDPVSELEMAKKKEMIMLQSLKRRAMQEAKRTQKEIELARQRDLERQKKELQERKKEEEKMRRTMILEQYRLRKAQEDADKDGNSSNFSNLSKDSSRNGSTLLLNRPSRSRPASGTKPRPKSLHVSASNMRDYTSLDPKASRITDDMDANYSNYAGSILNPSGSKGNGSRPGSSMSTPNNNPKRLPSPTSRLPQLPASLMLGRYKGGPASDGASDAGSTFSEYTGPKLYVKPTAKSNRGLIVNAINVVLAGAVNTNLKKKVLEEINNSDSKHFLILFRGAGMQFRAIYSYNPDREDRQEVIKLHGNGPKIVTDDMMDKFYKYNCGGKNFNEVQTKHLSVTIDAFTIHNTLWSGKRVIPAKKDSF